MAVIENINVGATPNDNTGDPLRDANVKANNNFQALNDQANESTNLKVIITISGTLPAGQHNITIDSGGHGTTNYKVDASAKDANGFPVPVREVSKTLTAVRVELFQEGIVKLLTQKS